MKKGILVFTVCILMIFKAYSQSYFAKNAIFGTGLAPDFYQTNDGQLSYLEFSWEKNIAIRLNKNFYFGLNYIDIYGKYYFPPVGESGKLKNFLLGGFAEFHQPVGEKFNFTANLGYFMGNHCLCNQAVQIDNLNYINASIGVDYKLFEKVYLTARLRTFFILQNVENRDHIASPFVGFAYRFGE